MSDRRSFFFLLLALTLLFLAIFFVLQDTFGNAQGRSPDPRRAMGQADAKLIVFSWDTHADQVRTAMAGDVDGYVSKSASAAELVDAVEQVHRGVRVVPVSLPPAVPGVSMPSA